MNERKQDLLERLTAQYKGLRRLYLVYLAAAVLALVFFFVDKRITLALLAASLIFHLTVVRGRSRAYAGAFVHACLQSTLERTLQGARHTPQSPLDPEELRQVRLVAANPAKGSVLTQEGGTGSYRGRPVRLSDAGFTHTFDMAGKRHHEFVIGAWVTVELDHDTGLDCRLIHPKVMMKQSRDPYFGGARDLQQVVSGLPDWMEAEGWLVLRPRETPRLPDQPFLSAVRRLAGSTQLPLALCVQGSRLHVYVTNRILGQKVSSRVSPGPAVVETDFFPELGGILKLSDAL